DDFVANPDRRSVVVEHEIDDLDRVRNSGAKTARARNQKALACRRRIARGLPWRSTHRGESITAPEDGQPRLQQCRWPNPLRWAQCDPMRPRRNRATAAAAAARAAMLWVSVLAAGCRGESQGPGTIH